MTSKPNDLEIMHSDKRLIRGNYDYQLGFLDAIKTAKEILANARTQPPQDVKGIAHGITPPSGQFRRCLHKHLEDYASAELIAEYQRRDGC